MKATPVSYLMYGPFGSFAPAYDSAFASLSKTDSELLLSTYGNELGVSYAHSLQQFVKGAGSFVTEMADAVLNGLTNNRHSKFVEKMKQTSGKESNTSEDKDSKSSPKESKPTPEPSSEQISKTTSTDMAKAFSPSSEGGKKDEPSLAAGNNIKATSQGPEIQTDTATSFPIDEATRTTSRDSITEESDTFPIDNDSRPPFSVGDMVTETSNTFPHDDESRSSFPDSQFESRPTSPLSESRVTSPLSESHATSPLSESRATSPLSESRATSPLSESRATSPLSNNGSGIPSVQGVDSPTSSKENSEVDASSTGVSSRSSSVSERDDQDEDSGDSHVSCQVIVM